MTVWAVAWSFLREESPDCIEQGVLLKKKDTADNIPREGKRNRKQTAGFFPVRVKRWGKSPPGVGENRTAWQAPPAARPNRGRAVARGVTSSGFWSHRQMIAAFLEGTKSGLQYRHSPDPVPGGSGQVVFALLIFPHGG